VALTDNKHLEGADYIVPVIRKSVATPAVRAALARLDQALTTDAISKLNLDVTVDKQQPAAVAAAWLKANNLT
jgi:osmoprotectant transport system substrate-binding protein